MRFKTIGSLVFSFLLATLALHAAETSQTIFYGNSAPNQGGTTVDLRLRLFTAAVGGTLAFEETQSVPINVDDSFTVNIGNGTSGGIPAAIFANNASLWATFFYESDLSTEIPASRVALSGGFSHFARQAAQAASLTPGISIQGAHNTSIVSFVNTANTFYNSAIRGESPSQNGWVIYGRSTSATGSSNAVIGQATSPNAVGVRGDNIQGTGTMGYTYFGKAVHGQVDGATGYAGYFEVRYPGNTSSALFSSTAGSGWAGEFRGRNRGVYISTTSGTGLIVSGGSKNAVVAAQDGARALYTEESSEVWFTDYGVGRTADGTALVQIDPLFAQTVNLNEPYHVFVQPYGAAQLYVSQRTANSFEVRTQAGDRDVEFSYRLAAKRRGFEHRRLERVPAADNDPNLYPER